MLGQFLKKRFEPSHALAMALSPEEVLRAESFGADAPETAAYLGGETLRTGTASGEKGWTLICVDGWSLGWAKCAGGALKNHYPRGLRTRC
jgi:NOL1/NOP2/fmu family ribosome biogenesis protein